MMDNFRQCFREVIAKNLVWPPLATSPCAIVSGAVHQGTHQALPAGDWRTKDRVEVYFPLSGTVVRLRRSVVHLVARGLTRAITWHKLAIYPRHRWLGCEAATSQPALLESCHGLLLPACAGFCYVVGDKVRLFQCLNPTANGLSDCARVPNDYSCIRCRAVGGRGQFGLAVTCSPLSDKSQCARFHGHRAVLNNLRGIARSAERARLDRPSRLGDATRHSGRGVCNCAKCDLDVSGLAQFQTLC